jgi:hypothetical protein
MKSTPSRPASGGFVLLAALLLVFLLTAMAVAVVYTAGTETRLGGTDRENTLAYYGAEAAMEQMMADLSVLYSGVQAPNQADIDALENTKPALPGIEYVEYDLGNTGATLNRTVSSGPHEGLVALITPMGLSVTARRPGGDEVRMRRDIEIALIPVFQFGIFSDTDLSYFPGPDFDFGGRVHTNANLFLASSSANGLKFHDRITVVGEVIRAELANGLSTVATGRTSSIWVQRIPGGCNPASPPVSDCRDLDENEGSKVGGPTSANNPNWFNLSTVTYNGNILNSTTGGRELSLPFVATGLRPIEIIRRPPPGELPTDTVASSRLYNLAQIRVLFSDKSTDLPGSTGVRLANVAPYYNGATFGATNTAFAEGRSDVNEPTLTAQDFIRPPNTPGLDAKWPGACAPPQNGNSQCWPLIDGYLLVQSRRLDGTYADVTMEWLNLGIARENPDAILLFQTFRDYTGDGTVDVGALSNSNPAKFYPINLYDTREGEWRDVRATTDASDNTCAVGGIMNVVEMDVGNLRRWLLGLVGTTGTQTESVSQNGYILYFSDRRGERDPAGNATGAYGYEDLIDPANANGVGGATPLNPIAANGQLDPPEDVNQNGVLETYGAVNIGEGFGVPNGNPSRRVLCKVPSAAGTADDFARKNRVSGARHGLKLINGGLGNLPTRPGGTGGFTVGSENPLYVQGNYNATTGGAGAGSGGWGEPNAAASVIADAVMLLSNNWNDRSSFRNPTRVNQGTRNAATTSYRMAIAAGKNINWPWPAWAGGSEDYGLDGGTHNFLRYLERWSSQTLHYQGSLVSLFYSEYSTGIYKCCQTVYSPPVRDYSFDTDFLDLNTMPPGTPMLRDVVNLGFRQVFRGD